MLSLSAEALDVARAVAGTAAVATASYRGLAVRLYTAVHLTKSS